MKISSITALAIKGELNRSFPQVKEFFLYGSVSKDFLSFDLDGNAQKQTSFDENSDYDFAVEYSKEVEQAFMGSGWGWKDQLDYQDCCTERVFEGVVLGEKVQISLRSKFEDFKAAWNSIPEEIYWMLLNKRSPKYIGREMTTLYLNSLVWLHEGVFTHSEELESLF